MLMEYENWRRKHAAGYTSRAAMESWPAAEGYLLFVARCAKRNKFHGRPRRNLPLLQHAGGGARGHACRHRRLAILAVEEIAAHGVTGVAPALIYHPVRDCVIRLPVLHYGQFQLRKILEHVGRLLLWSSRRNK